MFRSSTIIRELALNLAKVIFIQGGSYMTGTVTGLFTHKYSRSYLNHLVLKHSVRLHRYLLCCCVEACHGMACVLCAMQNVKTETCRNDTYVYFNVNFNVFFKLINVHLLVNELYIYQTAR